MRFTDDLDCHANKESMWSGQYVEMRDDFYGLRDFYRRRGAGNVKSFVDVGSNVGYSSVLATCLFPHAKRLAIEPGVVTFSMLSENLNGMGVTCVNMAIGNGRGAVLVSDPRMLSADKYEVLSGGEIPTKRLSTVLRDNKVPVEGMVLKVDCEGAEMWMTDDDELLPWMNGCVYFAAEFHQQKDESKTIWDAWLDKCFKGVPRKEVLLGRDLNGLLFLYVVERM